MCLAELIEKMKTALFMNQFRRLFFCWKRNWKRQGWKGSSILN